MLKLIASMSLVALLSLSPAFAHETEGPAAAPQKCSPLAKVLADVPAKPISQINELMREVQMGIMKGAQPSEPSAPPVNG